MRSETLSSGHLPNFVKRLMLVVIFTLCSFLSHAQAEKRVALVIGNANYSIRPLANPGNDAREVKAKLMSLGFKVTELIDGSKSKMEQTLGSFSRQAAGADLALVFYAGHGVEVGGKNYLVPVEAELAYEEDVDFQAVPLSLVEAALRRVKGAAVILLDACRNDPFALQASSGKRSTGRGLAPVSSANNRLLIHYAAKAGTTASDGAGRNSPYTKALLKHLDDPEEIRLVLGAVRDSVYSGTGNRQQPFQYGSLGGYRIYLAGKRPALETLEPINLADLWSDIRSSEDADLLEFFRDGPAKYDNFYRRLAEKKLASLRLVAGSTFRDCPLCPEIVVIPAGRFKMGSNDGIDGEKPVHLVEIGKPFGIGVYEVTVGEFEAFVNATGYEKAGSCWAYEEDGWKKRKALSWRDAGFSQGKNHPVVCVSWDDAQAYIGWLNSKVTGSPYRLPSESEWEYAARSGSGGKYRWGDGAPVCEQGHARGAKFNTGAGTACYRSGPRKGTEAVGFSSVNGFGLYDVHGNVWEWVSDCWNYNYDDGPFDEKARTSSGCSVRVLRGGAWFDDPYYLRSANRYWIDTSNRGVNIGFRITKTLH